jgi:hypothetical protein
MHASVITPILPAQDPKFSVTAKRPVRKWGKKKKLVFGF